LLLPALFNATNARVTTSVISPRELSTLKIVHGQPNAGALELEITSFADAPMTAVTFSLDSAPTLKASAATPTNATMKDSFSRTTQASFYCQSTLTSL